MNTKYPAQSASFFLIAVSTSQNLALCVRHGLAGFLSGDNGAWTYSEIEIGDFVSFLYGARAHNLYRVAGKEAIRSAEKLPPWEPLSFKKGGTEYTFPFRLHLEPIRKFVEPIVRTEFFYVAENLLLRGGYKKTHFQADQTTLQSVSELGTVQIDPVIDLALPTHSAFIPRFTLNPQLISKPEVFRFQEIILQSAIRRHLSLDANLDSLLYKFPSLNIKAESVEVLGEKALTKGHIDLLLKQRTPRGVSLKVPIEVKTKKGTPNDVAQIRSYMDELGVESPVGILIASDFAKRSTGSAKTHGVTLVRYQLKGDLRAALTFEEIHKGLSLEVIGH
jgi:hypothetical protein